jgi:hypothetical protein
LLVIGEVGQEVAAGGEEVLEASSRQLYVDRSL